MLKPTCLDGYLTGKDENLFISVYSNEREVMKNITLTGKLNGKKTELSSELTRNIMSISFP